MRCVRLWKWRRGWDSNPRLSFPNTRFPSVLLKPLGHLSASYINLTESQQTAKPDARIVARTLAASRRPERQKLLRTSVAVAGCGTGKGILNSLGPNRSGVVQLAAHQTLDLRILVRVQAPEPILQFANRCLCRSRSLNLRNQQIPDVVPIRHERKRRARVFLRSRKIGNSFAQAVPRERHQ